MSRPPSSDSLDIGRFAPGTMLTKRYRIVGPLGKGGMGEVYRADDMKLGLTVALKFLPRELEQDEGRRRRFLDEVRVALKVTHPNVCRVHDVGETGGVHFISMEYVDGEDLASLLRRIGRLPADKAIQAARQLCAGLAAAHDRGVLHRDLKPANVMIDGQGRVRITDFGLAGFAGEFRGAEIRAGTPSYMAPEQLAGEDVSVRSDIYALGLVLHEMFTGKRPFEASSAAEMLELQRRTTPSSLASHVEGIDPAVERTILRCLEADPARRPGSALSVAASLPGGDPLAAALAAGETPSPDLVAESGEDGRLAPWIAWTGLAIVLVGLGLVVALTGYTKLIRFVEIEKSPAALEEQARQVLREIGHDATPVDTAHGYGLNLPYLEHLKEQGWSGAYWENLSSTRPSTLTFFYRESPERLIPWSPYTLVSDLDPPPSVPGNMTLSLDPDGRLLEFRVASPVLAGDEPSDEPPDWNALFDLAGLDLAEFRPATPRLAGTIHADQRVAWTGFYPGEEGLDVRIEAGASDGRPVYFEILFPWHSAAPPGDERNQGALTVVSTAITLIAFFAGALVARRNLLKRRGHRQGAFRLALVFFTLQILWVPLIIRVDDWKFGIYFSTAIGGAVVLWMFYIACEPYVRRLWPQMLVSWIRLLDGRFRDPLVGRHVLLGLGVGLGGGLLVHLARVIPAWLGLADAPGPAYDGYQTAALYGPSLALEQLLASVSAALYVTLLMLVILLLLRMLFRRTVIAVVLTLVISLALNPLSALGGPWLTSAVAIFNLIALLVLFRAGLLPIVVAVYVRFVTDLTPLTVDPSSWFFGGSLAALATMVLLGGYGFYVSLGRQALLGDTILEG